MGFVTQSPTGTKGLRKFSLANLDDETSLQPLEAGEKLLIHATGMSGSTVNILCYTEPGGTGVAVDYDGTTNITTNFAYAFTAPGKCFVSVKLTVDGGTVTVTYTK